MKWLWYKTQPCPRCHNKITARLQQGTDGTNCMGIMGPIIFTSNPGHHNMMCPECGIKWTGDLRLHITPYQEYSEAAEKWSNMKDAVAITKKEQEQILYDMCKEADILQETDSKKKNSHPIAKKALGYMAKNMNPIAGIVDAGRDISNIGRPVYAKDDWVPVDDNKKEGK